MTKPEFTAFAAALKTYYPRENILPNIQAMELWFGQLYDIPYSVMEIALNKWVSTEKWSPTIADLREAAARIMNGDIPDWSEGWESVTRAINRYGRDRPNEALEGMDEITKTVVRRLGYTNLCNSENQSADRANFRMMYEAEAKKVIEARRTPETISRRIETIRNGQKNMIEGGGN